MENQVLSLIAGFLALVFVIFAYFTSKKNFLVFQALCIIFLIISYFFNLQFFAVVGMTISLIRSLTFYFFEKKNINASIIWSFIFATLTTISYVVVNFIILGSAQPLDLLCLSALIMYAFIFRIRNLKIVRFTMLAPTILSILFNILTGAAIFATMSYGFELGANLVSIVKYDILKKNKPIKE
ncbi:MAG: YgjV family protein [Clostridia bacterium]|nr:YgjV family protein [Clostridia bacterium]